MAQPNRPALTRAVPESRSEILKRYAIAAAAAIPLGVLSRLLPLGWPLWDKYLGDALYAIMIYLVLAWVRPRTDPLWLALFAFSANAAIECFQLTGIGLELSRSESPIVRLISIVLGTTFGWKDLLAYAVGIAAVAGWDSAGRGRGARES